MQVLYEISAYYFTNVLLLKHHNRPEVECPTGKAIIRYDREKRKQSPFRLEERLFVVYSGSFREGENYPISSP